jgi:drug/metabolite transporter (DMT)-like permease
VTATTPQSTGAVAAPGALDWTILAILVAIWGSAFAALRLAVSAIAPLWVVAGRLVIASVVLVFMLAIFGYLRLGPRALRAACAIDPPGWAAIRIYSLVGVAFTGVPFFFYAYAGETLASAVLAICNGAVPLFTALFAHAMLKGEPLTPRRSLGVMLGFSGLVALSAPSFAEGATATVLGLVLAIAGAALYSGGNIATRRAPPLAPVMSSLIITASGALFILPFALVLEPLPAGTPSAAWLAVGFLGVAPTAIGTILYVILIQRAGAVFVAFATYLTPLWAGFIGVVFLSEPLQLSMVVALTLILAGVAVASRRPRPAEAQPPG